MTQVRHGSVVLAAPDSGKLELPDIITKKHTNKKLVFIAMRKLKKLDPGCQVLLKHVTISTAFPISTQYTTY